MTGAIFTHTNDREARSMSNKKLEKQQRKAFLLLTFVIFSESKNEKINANEKTSDQDDDDKIFEF